MSIQIPSLPAIQSYIPQPPQMNFFQGLGAAANAYMAALPEIEKRRREQEAYALEKQMLPLTKLSSLLGVFKNIPDEYATSLFPFIQTLVPNIFSGTPFQGIRLPELKQETVGSIPGMQELIEQSDLSPEAKTRILDMPYKTFKETGLAGQVARSKWEDPITQLNYAKASFAAEDYYDKVRTNTATEADRQRLEAMIATFPPKQQDTLRKQAGLKVGILQKEERQRSLDRYYGSLENRWNLDRELRAKDISSKIANRIARLKQGQAVSKQSNIDVKANQYNTKMMSILAGLEKQASDYAIKKFNAAKGDTLLQDLYNPNIQAQNQAEIDRLAKEKYDQLVNEMIERGFPLPAINKATTPKEVPSKKEFSPFPIPTIEELMRRNERK